MPVAALPSHAVSALGSGQALTDPASLVKELMDNAIDGQANVITIEVSANTLDDIRVKDNGQGINPDDRSLVCLRHCTSKIRDLDELRTIGGRSLGFRGVALASAAELSGCLTISTRIEGEETSAELKFNRQGHLAGEKRTSLPVGTTVRAEKFLENHPVRRQAAGKTASKTLAKIKKLLQAYALARPRLRLSLKVLKAKDQRLNWKYPMNSGTNGTKLISPFDAAADILRKKITDQCQQTCLSRSSDGKPIKQDPQGGEGCFARASAFTFEVVLAKPHHDGSIISNLGQHLSVDSRPVSCAKGIFKQITSIYKSYLRSVYSEEKVVKVTDPFLCINIICPSGSYDVNVEPAKDDVLFTDADLVLSLARDLFKTVYGELKSSQPEKATGKISFIPQDISLTLARRRDHPDQHNSSPHQLSKSSPRIKCSIRPTPSNEQESYSVEPVDFSDPFGPVTSLNEGQMSTDGNSGACNRLDFGSLSAIKARHMSPSHDHFIDRTPSPINGSAWKSSMFDDGDDNGDNLDGLASSPAVSNVNDETEEGNNLRNIQISNPWAFAKLNATNRLSSYKQRNDVEGNTYIYLPTPSRQAGDAGRSDGLSSKDHQSPSAIAPKSTPLTLREHSSVAESGSSSPFPFPYPLRPYGNRKSDRGASNETMGTGVDNVLSSLDAWVRKSRSGHSDEGSQSDDDGPEKEVRGPADIPVPSPFVSARTLPQRLSQGTFHDGNQTRRGRASRRKQQQLNPNPSFVSPVHDLQKVWFDVAEKPKRKQPQSTPTRQRPQDPASLILRESEGRHPLASPPTQNPHAPIHPDLAITLEYEARKQLVTQQHRERLRQQAAATTPNTSPIPTSSPHKNRQRAALAALHSTDPSSSFSPHLSPNPSLPPSDPRAYLIRTAQPDDTSDSPPNPLKQQKKPLRRTRKSLLPFETLLQSDYTGDLIQPIDTKALDLDTLLRKGGEYDAYVRDGVVDSGFLNPSGEEVKGLEERMKDLVRGICQVQSMAHGQQREEEELKFDLEAVLKEHRARFS